MARIRNYRAEYERRKAKAISEGYKGYGQKRYTKAKAKRERQTADDNERKRSRIRGLLHKAYPPDVFDESGWLDRDATDREIKRILRRLEQRDHVTFDDVTVNGILFDDANRWNAFRAAYARMMGWAL